MKFHNPSFTIQKFQVDRKVEKKSMKFSKLHNFVKIGQKVLKTYSCHLLLSPNQCTKYDGSSFNTF